MSCNYSTGDCETIELSGVLTDVLAAFANPLGSISAILSWFEDLELTVNTVEFGIGLFQTIYYLLIYDDMRQVRQSHADRKFQWGCTFDEKYQEMVMHEVAMFDKACQIECYEVNDAKAQQFIINSRLEAQQAMDQVACSTPGYQTGAKCDAMMAISEQAIKLQAGAYTSGLVAEKAKAAASLERKVQAWVQSISFNPNFLYGHSEMAAFYTRKSAQYAGGVNSGLALIGRSLVEDYRTNYNPSQSTQSSDVVTTAQPDLPEPQRPEPIENPQIEVVVREEDNTPRELYRHIEIAEDGRTKEEVSDARIADEVVRRLRRNFDRTSDIPRLD